METAALGLAVTASLLVAMNFKWAREHYRKSARFDEELDSVNLSLRVNRL